MVDIARHSNENGFLQVGDTVEVSKKAETPNKSLVVVIKHAKVASLNYCIVNLQLENVQMAASASAFNLIGEDFDLEHYDIRKISPREGDDEGDDESEESSSVEYVNEELLNLYSD